MQEYAWVHNLHVQVFGTPHHDVGGKIIDRTQSDSDRSQTCDSEPPVPYFGPQQNYFGPQQTGSKLKPETLKIKKFLILLNKNPRFLKYIQFLKTTES